MPAWGQPGSEDDQETWELVHFIRRLKQLTPGELAEMETLNPKSRNDLEEEEAIRKFLAGEDPKPSAGSKPHEHRRGCRMRKASVVIGVVVVGFLALAGRGLAHEGHEHKVMGKVVTIDEKRIEVESTDGKKVTGVLSPDTKYLRDKAAATRTDVKVGERVVIVVVEDRDKVQNVKQVLLGAATSAEHKR